MKINLISKPDPTFPPLAQVLINRGIKPMDLYHYTHTSDDDISPPELLGEENMREAARKLVTAIKTNKKAFVIVDCDCDGYTSSALLLNFLHDSFPAWVENNLDYYMHSAKQHGLSDCIEEALNYDIVIIPDAGSNDYEYHDRLIEKGIDVIILDHHEAEHMPREEVITINNQLCDYPNKFLSGVGITWQFCRYLDVLLGTTNSDKYIDLVALGCCGDMMSLLSIETAHLIRKGFDPDKINNPFFYGMWQKNKFKIGEHPTPIGVAFYVVPFINAITRSGTIEEKKLIFSSMLKWRAFDEVLSNKRGHAWQEMETILDQALRTATNVKNRQTKAETAGMEFLESQVPAIADNKVYVFLNDNNQIDRNIAGLCANRMMARYQRPVAILSPLADGTFAGSMRGYTATGIESFKEIAETSPSLQWCHGHANAAGLCLADIPAFVEDMNNALKDVSTEIVHRVDYILSDRPETYVRQVITGLASAQMYYGQDVSEPLVALLNVKITSDNISVMKGNTLKITLPDTGIPILKFSASDAEIEQLCPQRGAIFVDFICRCNLNEWNGTVSEQLMLVDYEIKNKIAWEF